MPIGAKREFSEVPSPMVLTVTEDTPLPIMPQAGRGRW
jgi:hypothetical protein